MTSKCHLWASVMTWFDKLEFRNECVSCIISEPDIGLNWEFFIPIPASAAEAFETGRRDQVAMGRQYYNLLCTGYIEEYKTR